MASFSRSKTKGTHQLNLSGSTSYYIADVNELNGLVIGTDLVASALVFDPRTGKIWALTTGTITSAAGAITVGATDETPAGVPDGTVTNSILRWNGSAWVEESDITVDASGNVSTSGTITSTNSTASTNKDTGAIVTEGGIGVEGNVNTGGNVAAVGSVTGGTGVTATTGNVTASAGAVSANTTVTAGTDVVAGGVLDVNGTSASDIAGTLSVGSGTTSGTLTLTDGTDSVVLGITNVGSDAGKLAIGASYTAPTEDNHAAPMKYVDDEITAVVAGVAWKGMCLVVTDDLTLYDTSGNTAEFAAAADLDGTVGSLVTTDFWFFASDNDVRETNVDTTGTGTTLTVADGTKYRVGDLLEGAAADGIVTGTEITAISGNTLTIDTALGGTGSATDTIFNVSQITVNMNANAGAPAPLAGMAEVAVNDYVLTTEGTDRSFLVGSGFVVATAVNAAEKEAFGVKYDLINTTHATESAALYVANAANNWIKIGEFAIGQIQDGTVVNTLATWNAADNTWKQVGANLTFDSTYKVFGVGDPASAPTNSAVIFNSSSGSGISTFGIAEPINGVLLASNTASPALGVTTGTTSGTGSTGNLTVKSGPAAGSGSTGAAVFGSGDSGSGTTGAITIATGTTSGTRGNVVVRGNGIDLDGLASNAVTLTEGPTDQETNDTTGAVATVGYVRTDVIQREVNAAVADTGTQALTVSADAVKFYVKVKGNTTEADAYSSEITAIVNSGSTVDTVENNIVGNPAVASIAIARVSATSISCTVTNSTGETATIAIHAIPIR